MGSPITAIEEFLRSEGRWGNEFITMERRV